MMRLKHWSVIWLSIAFMFICLVVGQALKHDRLTHESGTIPPVTYER